MKKQYKTPGIGKNKKIREQRKMLLPLSLMSKDVETENKIIDSITLSNNPPLFYRNKSNDTNRSGPNIDGDS